MWGRTAFCSSRRMGFCRVLTSGVSRKVRVLLATDTYEPAINGIAVFTTRLAERLARRGHQVSVLAPDWPGRARVENAAGHEIVRVSSLPLFVHPYTRVCLAFKAKSATTILDHFRPDVVHVQTPWFIGAGTAEACAERGVPALGTHHVRPENFLPYLPTWSHRLVRKLFWKHVSSVYGRLELVIAPTCSATVLLRRHAMINQVKVISNGVDLNQFHPSSRVTTEENNAYHDGQKPVVLYVGRLDRDKGLKLLMKVVAEVVGKTDCRVIVCGVGSEFPLIRKKMAEMALGDRVTLAGLIANDRVADWYRLASVFIMTGEGETQPIAALEAMASGVPVVGVNATGLDDVIADGLTGVLVRPGASTEFCQQVIRILENPDLRRKLGREGRKYAERLHSFDNTTQQYLTWYEAVRQRNLSPSRRNRRRAFCVGRRDAGNGH
jgi:glycosyltransferase involved in cell wall biosynthesis